MGEDKDKQMHFPTVFQTLFIWSLRARIQVVSFQKFEIKDVHIFPVYMNT